MNSKKNIISITFSQHNILYQQILIATTASDNKCYELKFERLSLKNY